MGLPEQMWCILMDMKDMTPATGQAGTGHRNTGHIGWSRYSCRCQGHRPLQRDGKTRLRYSNLSFFSSKARLLLYLFADHDMPLIWLRHRQQLNPCQLALKITSSRKFLFTLLLNRFTTALSTFHLLLQSEIFSFGWPLVLTWKTLDKLFASLVS